MIVRNKKTGEIGRIAKTRLEDEEIEIITETKVYIYTSLLKISMEWEDYEEPKEHWIINAISGIETTDRDETDEPGRAMIEIGNYFETKEEAEKAVEKLKAWKRLKDNGVKLHLHKQFRGDGIGYSRTIYTDFSKDSEEIIKDLDLIFGGEE